MSFIFINFIIYFNENHYKSVKWVRPFTTVFWNLTDFYQKAYKSLKKLENDEKVKKTPECVRGPIPTQLL